MAGLLLLFQPENAVGAEFDAVPAVDAYPGFFLLIVPEYRPYDARITAMPAPDALCGIQNDPASGPFGKGVGGAYPGAGGIVAGPAHDNGESPFHPSDGTNTDACMGEPRLDPA